MMNNLKKDICDNFNTKYLKIPHNADIITFLNNKIKCTSGTKNLDRIKKDGKIIKLNDTFSIIKYNDPLLINLSDHVPLFINNYININEMIDSDFMKSPHIDYENNDTNCALCDLYHIAGFNNTQDNTNLSRYIFGNYYPQFDETILIYKGFYICFNSDPYMKNHLMLLTNNHEATLIKGSQYEILNREILDDVVNIYIKISDEYLMGSNYAMTGSQQHFHIHIFKKEEECTYGLDNSMDHLATEVENRVKNHIVSLINDHLPRKNIFKEYETFIGTKKHIKYTLYLNSNNYSTRLISFNHQIYGYKGYLLTMSKTNATNRLLLNGYISCLYKLLNQIEYSSLYTFTLYFCTSKRYLNIIIQCQNKSKFIHSFRNISGFIFSQNNKNFDYTNMQTLINAFKDIIDKNIYNDILDSDDIFEILSNNVLSGDSFYGNTSYRYITDLSLPDYVANHTNKFINEIIKKPVNADEDNTPKIILISGPIGSGKSLIYKNLKKYFSFYDEKDYVHINVDDIIYNIPHYKKNIDKISKFLQETYLKKPFAEYKNNELKKYGKLTIEDLKDNNIMLSLDINAYNCIYAEILNDKINGMSVTINKYSTNEFQNITKIRNLLEYHLISICSKNKLNIVYESARRTWDFLTNINYLKLEDIYQHHNIFYVGKKLNDTIENQKFLLRNVLLRNIYEGRILDSTIVIDNLKDANTIQETFERKILYDNIRIIYNNYKITMDMITNKHIMEQKLSVFEKFNINYPELVCVNANDFNKLDFSSNLLKLENNKNKFQVLCIKHNKSNIDNVQDDRIKLKKIMTDINNKYFLDENTTSILIYNTIANIENIISKLCIYFNTNPELLSTELNESDIKLVLKGGLNIRLLVKSIFNYFEKNINFNDDLNKNKKLIKKIIEEIDSEFSIDNPFSNNASKSDIDFIVLINKNKFNKSQYSIIKERLIVLIIEYLFILKMHIHETSFFGMEYNYDNIKFDNTIISKIGRKMHKSIIICKNTDLHFNTKPPTLDSQSALDLIIYHDNIFLTIPPIKQKVPDNYYVSYIKEIKISSVEINNTYSHRILDIIRLKNNYSVVKPTNTTNTANTENTENIPGELIDIVINDYDSANINDDDLFKINYSNNLLNFDINVFNIDYLILDIEHVIYADFMYPWVNEKYEKRISRYILLLITSQIIKLSNLNSNPKDFVDLISTQLSINIREILHSSRISSLPSDHILYNLIKYSKFIKSKINLANKKDCKQRYEQYLTAYRYDILNIDYNIHLSKLKDEYDKYVNIIEFTIKKANELFKLLSSFINDEIKKDINKYYSDKKFGIVQWGGFKTLHKSYKDYYLKLKGGAITFNTKQIFNVNTSKDISYNIINGLDPDIAHLYSDVQKTYLEYFFDNVLLSVSVDNFKFTTDDVRNTVPTNCGSSGCGILINNSSANKKFIIKIIGSGTDGPINYNNKINTFLKETYIGYYITQTNLPNFNKTLAYFKTSSTKTDTYFSSISDTIKLENHLYNNSNANINGKNIFILLIEAGDNNLTNLSDEIIKDNNLSVSFQIDQKNAIIDVYIHIFKQMFSSIAKISHCSNISKYCIYMTHMDIKPDNIIFKKTINNSLNPILKHQYNMEYIDYGSIILSKTFFSKSITTTPFFERFTFHNTKPIASPLYDLATTIYSMFYILIRDFDNNSLKIAYIQENQTDIATIFNEIRLKLTNAINLIFFNKLVNPTTDANAQTLVNILIYYLNFALCIFKFHHDFHNEFSSDELNKYANLEFKNFKLLKLDSATPQKLLGFERIQGKNNELLDKLVQIVENSVNLYKY